MTAAIHVLCFRDDYPVTLDMVQQLDHVEFIQDLEPMGRVRINPHATPAIVGRSRLHGSLVIFNRPGDTSYTPENKTAHREFWAGFNSLPLILVLGPR